MAVIREPAFFRKTNQEGPVVTYCEEEYVRNEKCLSYGPVVRSVYLIECCTAGSGSVVINGKEFPVSGGTAYVLLPGDEVLHRHSSVENRRKGVYCVIDGAGIGRYFQEAGITSESPYIQPELFDVVYAYVREMIEDNSSTDAGKGLRQTARIYNIFGALLRNCSGKRESWVDRAVALMDTRYHEPLTVEQIAREIGLERTYFSAVFREKTGLSPYQCLAKLRIEKACALLKDKRYSVADVAYMVGLDPRNFSRQFKKEIGKTPLQYKKDTMDTK